MVQESSAQENSRRFAMKTYLKYKHLNTIYRELIEQREQCGVARGHIQSNEEKRFNTCAKLMARIRSHTTHDIPSLSGQVPETVVTGNTTDISQMVEFSWHNWVYFRDTSNTFPEKEELHMLMTRMKSQSYQKQMTQRIMIGISA